VTRFELLYAIIGLLSGLILGFIITNAINQAEFDKLRTQIRSPQTKPISNNTSSANQEESLSEEEIKGAIAQADSRKDDLDLQKKFGLVLYSYLKKEPNPKFLPDLLRVLKRAHDADPKDYNLLIALGDTLLEIGQSSEAGHIAEARTYYLKALDVKPDDPELYTRLGLTYYLEEPSKTELAIKQYQQALSSNPKHEPAIEHLTTALISIGKLDEASKRLDELEKLNPSNRSVPNLRAYLAQRRNELK
jgi:predicted Zn-dependent protease